MLKRTAGEQRTVLTGEREMQVGARTRAPRERTAARRTRRGRAAPRRLADQDPRRARCGPRSSAGSAGGNEDLELVGGRTRGAPVPPACRLSSKASMSSLISWHDVEQRAALHSPATGDRPRGRCRPASVSTNSSSAPVLACKPAGAAAVRGPHAAGTARTSGIRQAVLVVELCGRPRHSGVERWAAAAGSMRSRRSPSDAELRNEGDAEVHAEHEPGRRRTHARFDEGRKPLPRDCLGPHHTGEVDHGADHQAHAVIGEPSGDRGPGGPPTNWTVGSCTSPPAGRPFREARNDSAWGGLAPLAPADGRGVLISDVIAVTANLQCLQFSARMNQ